MLVPKADDNADSLATGSSSVKDFADTGSQPQADSPALQVTQSSSRAFIRGTQPFKGVSESVMEIILKSWRDSTLKQYWSYLKRWIEFCGERETDPVCTNVNSALIFLRKLYDDGISYSGLNTARSALSSISPDNIGNHSLVVRFMKGVFHSRPSRPRYTSTWDVSVVLKFLKTWDPPGKLSLKKLTLKVIMLLALLTGQRGQTLFNILLTDITLSKSCLKIHISSLLKQSRPSFHIQDIELPSFSKDKSLCIVHYMKHYIDRTKKLRSGTKLFVTSMRPYGDASRDTISRWIKTVLNLAGIDTTVFKSHSTRMASTSKARALHVPIDDILKSGGWSKECTFRKFYNRPINRKNNAFSKALLDNV